MKIMVGGRCWLLALLLFDGLGVVFAGERGVIAQGGQPTVAPRVVAKVPGELLAAMTLEEKVGQLGQVFTFAGKNAERLVRNGQVGSLLFVFDPAAANKYQRIAVEETRLGIPLLLGFDVVHGFRTIFPVPIALGSSWDPALVEKVQSVAAIEARAAGVHWTFAPVVDVARDARWGRIVEGSGEDPYLTSVMAAAQVRGFQGGRSTQPGRVIAGVKHFAGYGAANGGRDYDEVDLSDAALWNVYLPPFKAALDAGAGNVMSAYMPLNGVPATASRWLLSDVLRKHWNFQGFVVSDANAVQNLVTHGFAATPEDAAVRALAAGLDMEMHFTKPAMGTLVQAAREGRVSQAQIDAAVRRILAAKFQLGLFEKPYVDETRAEAVLADPEHRKHALVAAQRSAVLLRNEKRTLPLDRKSIRSIAVIGPFADSARDTLGPWVFNHDLNETVTIAAGIRKEAGSRIRVEVAPGLQSPKRLFRSPFDQAERGPKIVPWNDRERGAQYARAIAAARSADVVVAVLGQAQDMSGESASVASFAMPADQQQLLEEVVALGRPVVLVLMNGRPLDISWAAQHVPAILEVWHPGSQGGAAVADLLFGKVVPGGKLPVTWPRSAGQSPLFYARSLSHEPANADKRYWNEDGSPLFPFGYGLSYTTFAFSAPKIARAEVPLGEPVRVTVEVSNTGDVAGDEVVQMYIHQRSGRAVRPVRELKGFQRVTLKAGETRSLSFELSVDALKYWSSADQDWVIDPAQFDVWVGSDSATQNVAGFRLIDERLRLDLRVHGER
jgi:beta-glucosidase